MTLHIKNLIHTAPAIPYFLKALSAIQQKVAVIGHVVLTFLSIELMKGTFQAQIKKVEWEKIKKDIQGWPIKEKVEVVKKAILDYFSRASHYIQNKFQSKPATLPPKKENPKEQNLTSKQISEEKKAVLSELPVPKLPIIEPSAPLVNNEKKPDPIPFEEQQQNLLFQKETLSVPNVAIIDKPETVAQATEYQKPLEEPISQPCSAPPTPYRTPKPVGKGIAARLAKLNKQKGFIGKEEGEASQKDNQLTGVIGNEKEGKSSQIKEDNQLTGFIENEKEREVSQIKSDPLPVQGGKLPVKETIQPSDESHQEVKLDITAQRNRARLKKSRRPPEIKSEEVEETKTGVEEK